MVVEGKGGLSTKLRPWVHNSGSPLAMVLHLCFCYGPQPFPLHFSHQYYPPAFDMTVLATLMAPSCGTPPFTPLTIKWGSF